MKPPFALLLLAAVSLSIPTMLKAETKTELWVYTSIYKEFAAPLAKAFEDRNPGVSVQVFQGGSEKIQAKIEAEVIAKTVQADILLTSDPFWSAELDKRGLVYTRPGHPGEETNYFSVMVLIAHKDLPEKQRPQTFADLADPRFDKLVQMGSPLESGTMFSAVAYLSQKYGWDYFDKLHKNHIASSGGNSTVIQKVESGEKKIGMVLLENALAARKRGSPIEIIYPADGSIPIPSVQVITKDSAHKDVASRFADFVLTVDGQKLLRNGYMYAVNSKVAPPEGAKPLTEITANSTAWTPERIRTVAEQGKKIKSKFADMILE